MQFTEDLHKNLKQVEASEAPRGYFSLVLRDEARGLRSRSRDVTRVRAPVSLAFEGSLGSF